MLRKKKKKKGLQGSRRINSFIAASINASSSTVNKFTTKEVQVTLRIFYLDCLLCHHLLGENILVSLAPVLAVFFSLEHHSVVCPNLETKLHDSMSTVSSMIHHIHKHKDTRDPNPKQGGRNRRTDYRRSLDSYFMGRTKELLQLEGKHLTCCHSSITGNQTQEYH